MKNESYLWAWRRLRDRVDTYKDPAPRFPDAELVEAVIETVIPRYASKGTGRFDRVCTYIDGVCETLEWIKSYWQGSDEVLTAFMIGVEVSCQALKKEVKLIDRQEYFLPEKDWGKP